MEISQFNEDTLRSIINKHIPQRQMSNELKHTVEQQVLLAVAATFPSQTPQGLVSDLSTYANWREEQRFLAWEFSQCGWKQSRIAEVLDVSPCTVSRWLKRAQYGGRDALCTGKRSNLQPGLTAQKLRHLPRLMARLAAEDLGTPTGVYSS